MGRFANDIGTVADKFTQAGYGITTFGNALSQLGGPLGVIGSGIAAFGGAISTIGASISGATGLISLFTVGITDATGAVVVAGSTIAAVAAPLAALAAGFLLVRHHIKQVKEAGAEVTETFNESNKAAEDNIAKLKSYQGEFAQLSKGVDSNGNNVSLDDSQYQRYLEIVDDIAAINPEIVDGYNAQGHAIINNNKALAETLKKQQEIKDEAYKTYTEEGSLQKLINARNISSEYRNNIINPTSSKAEDAGLINNKRTPFAADVRGIADLLSLSVGAKDFDFTKYGIDSLDALKNGEEKAVQNFVKHRQQIETDLSNSGVKLSDAVIKGFDTLGDNVDAFDEAIKPVYDNLLTNVSNSPIFESIAPEFRSALQTGLKDLASQDLNASEMAKAANNMAARFANLTTGSGKYKDALDIVETAQNKFADTLNETEYRAEVQPAINDLIRLKQEALDEGSAYGDALAEYLENQIQRISNFTQEGGANLTEALNTATDEIAAAEGALDSFNEATKTDYSTAAEGMKSIFEKTTETFKDSYGEEIQKHAEGMGDATFWSGAEALLSTDAIDQITASASDGYEAAEQVSQAIADLEPMLREGQEGFDAFTDRVLEHSEALDELAQYGVEYNKETGLLTNIPDDQWHNVAEALGISDELLTSMLNKGRQFADISFMNVEDAREALATSDFTIKGTSAAPGEQQNVYVKEDTLRAELREAGYVHKDQQDEQITKLLNEGVKTIPSAEEMTVSDMKDMAGDWGIKTLPDLIQTLNDTGDFTKDEIKAYADKLDLLESDDNFDSLYSDIIEAAENPELVKQTGVLEDISGKVSALMDGRTGDKALDDYNESHEALVGGEGVDTEAQAFAYGKKLNEDGTLGGFLSAGEYEQTKKSLEEVKQSYIESAAIAAEKVKITTGKEKERWEEVQKGYEEDAARVDKYLGMASNAYEKHLKDMAEAAEAKKIAPGVKRAEDKDSNKGTTTKNEVETTETKTTKEITEKEEHTQVVADAITTGAYEVVNQELNEIDANPNHNTNVTTTGDSQGVDEVRAGLASAIAEAKDPLKILTVGDTTGITTVSSGLSTLPSSKDISITASDNTGGVIGRISSKLASLASKALHIGGGGAAGINNHISVSRVPTFASAAKGKGQVGPKNKGGLTLTGEKGFEIAWLPSSGESMVLGVGGPQMVNLPSDAVVYTHEQSKDIIKRKGIPAGSHADETASVYKKKYNNGNTTPTTTTTTTTNTKKIRDAADKLDNAADNTNTASSNAADAIQRVSVWWDNMERRVDTTQNKIDDGLDKIEKKFKVFGTTVTSMKKIMSGYRKNLKTSISLNKREVKKAKAELKSLDKGKAASTQSERQKQWENGAQFLEKISYKVGDDTTTIFADLSYYVKKLKDGTYVVDQARLDKIANREQRKATADAANKAINDKVSKLNKAQENIKKAREALNKLADDVYETFYRWEKSITQVYILSQKLEQLNSRLTTASSQAELQYSKLLAGVINSATALPEIINALATQRELMVGKVNTAQANIEATKGEYLSSLSLSTYQNRYNQAKKANGGVVSQEAKNDLKAAKQALQLFNNANKDYGAAVRALNKKNISSDEYNAIKEVLDNIHSKQNAFIEAQNNGFDTVKEIYDKIEEYQSFISEFETDLLSGLEKEAENQIKHLDKLNSSLTKAYKDLLDEVKRKLDERRKQEDNAKTEQDISQKQQRLAALRADTSGGHQVEIAQLEKEIAEAQQNYQRTLEDQLLDKLQQQGDEAEKQRQRQIELLEAQNEIASDLGTNLEQVKIWLSDPERYFENIKNAWLENRGYSDALPEEQKQLREQFESAWAQYRAYTQDLPQFMTLAGSRLTDIGGNGAAQVDSLTNAENYLYNIAQDLTILRTYGMTVAEAVSKGYTNQQIHDAGYTASEFKAGIPEATIKEAMEAGYKKGEAAAAYGAVEAMTTGNIGGRTTQKATGASAKELQQIINSDTTGNAIQKDLAGVSAGKFDSNGSKKGGTNISGAQLSDTGKSVGAHKGSTFYWQDWDEKTGKLTGKVKSWTIDKLPAKYVGAQADARQALKYAIEHQDIGTIINKNMEDLINASDNAKKYFVGQNFSLKGGFTGSMGSKGIIYYNKEGTVWAWNPATGSNKPYRKYDKKIYLDEAKKNGNVSAAYARALIQRKAYTKKELQNKGVTKFATGGLASTTGLAWLDGTPSKPELVLNATDTKNFLVLKDVLATAMKGMSNTSNSYGDITYEININVDKIEKDYDVDRVVEKVKKEITKGAGYRNVTQVRNLK